MVPKCPKNDLKFDLKNRGLEARPPTTGDMILAIFTTLDEIAPEGLVYYISSEFFFESWTILSHLELNV